MFHLRKSSARWCRRLAIRKSAEAATLLLQLLDDEYSNYFGASEDELLDSEIDDDDDEAIFTSRHELAYVMGYETGWDREQMKRKKNVMHEMMDDLDLRLWCEMAIERSVTSLFPRPADHED